MNRTSGSTMEAVAVAGRFTRGGSGSRAHDRTVPYRLLAARMLGESLGAQGEGTVDGVGDGAKVRAVPVAGAVFDAAAGQPGMDGGCVVDAAGDGGPRGGYEQNGVLQALAAVGTVTGGLAAAGSGRTMPGYSSCTAAQGWVLERFAAMRAASSSAAAPVRLFAKRGISWAGSSPSAGRACWRASTSARLRGRRRTPQWCASAGTSPARPCASPRPPFSVPSRPGDRCRYPGRAHGPVPSGEVRASRVRPACTEAWFSC